MKKDQKDKLFKLLYVVASLLVLAGALFKLRNHPNGDFMLFAGFISGSLISGFEIHGLKKEIKELEKQENRK